MRIVNARDIGALIRDRRETLAWSQETLATRSGVSKRWVVAVEAGKPGAQIGMVLRVLSALDVELDATVGAGDDGRALDALLDRLGDRA